MLEYLWKAANALHPEDKQKQERWVSDRAKRLLEGHSLDVASGLRRAATRAGLRGSQRDAVDTAAGYIEKNSPRLRYDQALTEGLPIATGVIEGACRHLVKDRMDITGARWGLTQAEAILQLRSLSVSKALNAYWGYHFRQAHRRNYPWDHPAANEPQRQAA